MILGYPDAAQKRWLASYADGQGFIVKRSQQSDLGQLAAAIRPAGAAQLCSGLFEAASDPRLDRPLPNLDPAQEMPIYSSLMVAKREVSIAAAGGSLAP